MVLISKMSLLMWTPQTISQRFHHNDNSPWSPLEKDLNAIISTATSYLRETPLELQLIMLLRPGHCSVEATTGSLPFWPLIFL